MNIDGKCINGKLIISTTKGLKEIDNQFMENKEILELENKLEILEYNKRILSNNIEKKYGKSNKLINAVFFSILMSLSISSFQNLIYFRNSFTSIFFLLTGILTVKFAHKSLKIMTTINSDEHKILSCIDKEIEITKQKLNDAKAKPKYRLYRNDDTFKIKIDKTDIEEYIYLCSKYISNPGFFEKKYKQGILIDYLILNGYNLDNIEKIIMKIEEELNNKNDIKKRIKKR